MDINESEQKRLDPYEVHKENMQLLKILPVSYNRSAPNSPMLRRAKGGEAISKANFLSPSPQRKDLKKVTEDNRSKSLNLLTVSGGNSPSPSESPVGSPLSVSDRIIRTHYLSNTTGKPGSYLLKKSDEIVRNKWSPTGSPNPGSSPNIGMKGANAYRQPVLNDINKDKLSVPHPIPVVISPANSEATIGFKGYEKSQTFERKPTTRSTKSEHELLEPSELEMLAQEDKHIEDVRQSIGDALKPKPPPSPPPAVEKQFLTEIQDASKKLHKKEQKREKLRLHHYEKYGNTNKSPGLLTPPLEQRGSKDLSAEMAKWERKERRKFQDLEHVEESSSIGPSDDDYSSEEESDKQQDAQQVYTMPPVFQNVAHQPMTRDFSVPMEIPEGVDQEAWDQMKRCRYLRIEEDADDDDDEVQMEEDLSDSSDQDMKTDEEDN